MHTTTHSSASASENENYTSLRSKSGSVWLGPTVLNSLRHAMRRNSTHSARYGYFCILAAITVSPVTGEEYYMQINFCLARRMSCYLTQLAGPCPRAGICPFRSSFRITDVWNTLSPEQSQRTNTRAKSSKWHQSSCGNTGTIKLTNWKGVPVGSPRCLIWQWARILIAVLSQVT